ncbi:glycogen debranching enzyme [Leguminivora glycinivorella]|uniref:glycogen debranching enzyme n=1 Tax=Leguminivora glycinivorella TaxID=1035111 RepID=UPI00200EEFFC|nr:glycogen debranching enzyme [Leguminivora glycinivorella]
MRARRVYKRRRAPRRALPRHAAARLGARARARAPRARQAGRQAAPPEGAHARRRRGCAAEGALSKADGDRARRGGRGGAHPAPALPAPGGAPPAAATTRLLTLEHGEHHDSTIYRFEKGTTVRFRPGPSLLGRKVFLYTNYIITDSQDEKAEVSEFVRNQYYALEWRREEEQGGAREELGAGALVTDTDLYADLRLARAGPFHYYFVYDSAESAIGPRGSGWLQVAAGVRVGPGGRDVLPVEALACQTVLAKCLGPLARWEDTLRVAKESGYNMIHFTPIQELGASNSSYSLADQLKLNPAFGADASFADVDNLLTKLRCEWRVASICDVVLNHTANETPWLALHPEATYNCVNVPRLRAAALLDAALARVTRDAARGDLLPRGIPPKVNEHEHLEAVRHYLESAVLPELRLHELYCCNVPELLQQFYCLARNKVPPVSAGAAAELALVPDPQHRRLHATVDMDRALQLYNVYRADCYDEEARLKKCCEELRRRLEELNAAAREELQGHLRAALDNCVAGMRYFRLQADGPKIEEVSEKNPLVPRYFTAAGECGSAAEAEALVFGDGGRYVMAHNGWVMDADPLMDFAHSSHVYLRRELIAWGDSVKLRYGDKPEDSPWLWAHMREYVELTAELFDGLRLDNCHSTPLHVAEYMMDCARNVKPDLFVAAELFTNSDHVDNIFLNRLGISALIREAQAAWDSREQGRLLHRFGGRAVGAFRRAAVDVARPGLAPALLLDLTHDNPSPLEKRSVHDVLPTAALVSMAFCAAGSTRGLDELVPHHVHVVDEARLYPAWGEGEGRVGAATGLLAARKELNLLHCQLAQQGYDEVYVDQMTEAVTAVTRHSSVSRRSVLLAAHTAFAPPQGDAPLPPPLRFEGDLEEILFEMELQPRSGAAYSASARYINGLEQWTAAVRRRPAADAARFVAAARREGALTVLDWRAFPPGAVIALRIAPRAAQRAALDGVRRTLALWEAGAPDALGLERALAPLQLADYNALLFRCDAEERDAGAGGVYDVPGHGPLVYAGLQGLMSLLEEVRSEDALGHAVCDNLRAGDWLLDYTWRRLSSPALADVASRLRELLAPLSDLPRYLVPTYAEATLRAVHAAVTRAALARMTPEARSGEVARALALCSVQLLGAVPSATLPALSPALAPPRPPGSTLSAGLPHFAAGYMRCWGRDTFIALRGAAILTGRYQEARAHILGFAGCLRHGLIPNLLDGGRNARYNCRDAVWWWLHAIKQYVCEAPAGLALLAEPVSRLFPADDAAPAPPGAADQPLHDVMQEALAVHFQGLVFRERNAGRQIDAHMTDKGFNVQIGVQPDTGFPFGGNDANCGTWMDKMGSSERAGTRGRPATPRDGSAVELVALAYSAVSWLADLHRAGRFPHAGVARRHPDGALTSWTYAQWAERIRRAFERHFWVPPAPSAQDLRPDLVHRRAIYKDSHGASQPWADYQLRCNAVVAMAVAPDLFDPKHAWQALDTTEKVLLGPLGLKTLDPADWAYRPEYDNSNDSDDPSVAHGFNYHQGPEWAWPLGFYLRARLAFAHDAGRWAKTLAAVHAALAAPAAELRRSPWRGLPELTGPGGAPCRDSCRTQAWSSACLLELLHELRAARRARPLPAD